MKAILINGSPREKMCVYTALTEVQAALETYDVQSEIFWVGNQPVQPCISCLVCRGGKQSGAVTKAGHCVFDGDVVNQLIDKINEADAVVIGSPVYFAGISGQLKMILDRVFYAENSFAYKLGAAVVTSRRSGALTTFDTINHYFECKCMPVVPSQYWNNLFGNSPEEIMQDTEGIDTMKVLAKNMAWLLRCIEAGEKSGIPKPIRDVHVKMNFIR